MKYWGAIQVYRHRLPHWRGDGATYFVTWRVAKNMSELKPEERSLVATTLRHFCGLRYRLDAFVIMNDHVHVLVSPFDGQSLESIVHSWKSFSAHELQRQGFRQGSVWQDEYMDRIVRDEAEFTEKARYIANNPWKRWPGLKDYEWLGLGAESPA
jgi:REP element-mobilizing transposase RayT